MFVLIADYVLYRIFRGLHGDSSGQHPVTAPRSRYSHNRRTDISKRGEGPSNYYRPCHCRNGMSFLHYVHSIKLSCCQNSEGRNVPKERRHVPRQGIGPKRYCRCVKTITVRKLYKIQNYCYYKSRETMFK